MRTGIFYLRSSFSNAPQREEKGGALYYGKMQEDIPTNTHVPGKYTSDVQKCLIHYWCELGKIASLSLCTVFPSVKWGCTQHLLHRVVVEDFLLIKTCKVLRLVHVLGKHTIHTVCYCHDHPPHFHHHYFILFLSASTMISRATDGGKNIFGNPNRLNSLFTQSSIPIYQLRVCQIQGLNVGNKKLAAISSALLVRSD